MPLLHHRSAPHWFWQDCAEPQGAGPEPQDKQAPLAELHHFAAPQVLHVKPSTPHATLVLPGTQAPFWQQPPLQAVRLALPQEVVQTCVTVLHA